MRCRSLPILIVIGLVGFPAWSQDDDAAKLQGAWTLVALETGGKPLPDEPVKAVKLRMTFKDGKVTTQSGGESKEGAYKLDSAKKPKEIDVTFGTKTSKGIYQLDGDTLKLCVSDSERPTEFTTKPGGTAGCMTLKKDK